MSLKENAKTLLLETGALRLKQFLLPRSVVILAYHSVSNDREGQRRRGISHGITVETERFREQMRLVRRYYHPVTMDEVADWLRGERDLPPRSVAVTFDDGYADNYELAAPEMEQFDLRGAFYLTVDSVLRQQLPWFCRIFHLFHGDTSRKKILEDPASGRRWNLADPTENRRAFVECNKICAGMEFEDQQRYIDELESRLDDRLDPREAPKMMSFEQARELVDRGHVIGNHSYSHGNLAHIPESGLDREIVRSHDILRKELGRPVEHFSYPHPSLHPQWNEATRNLTEKLGYKTAVLTATGFVTRNLSPLLLPRVTIVNPDSRAFRWKLETAFAGIDT